MRYRTIPALILVAGLACLSLTAGEVTGTVTWDDKVPKMRPLSMDADPVCANHHTEEPAVNETLVLGEGNTMANIFVQVVGGLPDKKHSPPSEPAVLDQKGCLYVPHVLAVMVDQDVKILNSDGILHNVNVSAKKNRGFNLGMPKGTTEAVKSFSEEELPIDLKCNVHPWMKAYLMVVSHPYFDVTDKDGSFAISGLPPGTYEIEAWHERAGTRKGEVTIAADGDVKTIDFSFSR